MSMTDQVASEVIRDRTTHRGAFGRPHHRRTARVLRRLAARLEGSD